MDGQKPNQDYDVLMKVVVIGDSDVGKTNLLSRYIRNEFKLESKSTIGVEFSTKCFQMEGKRIKAQLWDTAGEEKFRAVAKQYYRNAVSALLVYDTTNFITLEHCERWLQECRTYADPNIKVTLVGNKIDLRHLQSVSQTQAKDFATRYNIRFIETSALTNANVDSAFTQVLNDGFEVLKSSGQLDRSSASDKVNVNNAQPGNAKLWKCCWRQ